MRAVALGIALGLLALACGPSHGQARRIGFPPSYRAGLFLPQVAAGPTLTGDCAKAAPSGLTMTACYDFANGSYTSDGVTPQASFVAAGGTLPSGCTVTAGTGLTCTGAASSIATTAAATNVMLVTSGTDTTGSTVLAALGPGAGTSAGNINDSTTAANARQVRAGSQQAASSSASQPLESAVCMSSTSAGAGAIAGGAGATTSGGTGYSANPTLYLAGGSNTVASGPLRSVRLFTGTCNAANVQAASGS